MLFSGGEAWPCSQNLACTTHVPAWWVFSGSRPCEAPGSPRTTSSQCILMDTITGDGSVRQQNRIAPLRNGAGSVASPSQPQRFSDSEAECRWKTALKQRWVPVLSSMPTANGWPRLPENTSEDTSGLPGGEQPEPLASSACDKEGGGRATRSWHLPSLQLSLN